MDIVDGLLDGLRVVVYFGGVSRVWYTARSRADSRFWTMFMSSCEMVDGELRGLELWELFEVVSLIQKCLIGWTLMDELKSNKWLYMEVNELLEWLSWLYDLKIYQM